MGVAGSWLVAVVGPLVGPGGEVGIWLGVVGSLVGGGGREMVGGGGAIGGGRSRDVAAGAGGSGPKGAMVGGRAGWPYLDWPSPALQVALLS